MDLKKKIFKVAEGKKKFKTKDVLRAVKGEFSRQYVSKTINELVEKGELLRRGKTKAAVYALPENEAVFEDVLKKRFENNGLEEDKVLEEFRAALPFLDKQRKNVNDIFSYVFTEILNNAIEHSESENIEVTVKKEGKDLIFVIRDFGIGVFWSVMRKTERGQEIEAIQDILKGKTTTAPESHSGEGIFFTLKASDIFVLESHRLGLRVDNRIEDIFVEKLDRKLKGTKATFVLSVDSQKELVDIFKKYQLEEGDLGFDKTEIRVDLYALKTSYISRSQARRLLVGLDKFKKIILDFENVSTIGQAFADEIFRVFKASHPQIEIEPVNMNQAVSFMINRIQNSTK